MATRARKRLIFSLILVTVSLGLAAVAAEIFLELREARRLYREAAHRFHPFVQLTPNAQVLDGINSDRFRGDPIALDKPAKTLRIFTLGGSTTLGVRNSFESSYPRLMQRRLQQQFPGTKIEVQNAGVDWYTTAHLLSTYQLRVRSFHPDLVIVMIAMNDLVRSFAPPWLATGPFRADYSHYLGPQVAFLGPPVGFQDDYDRSGWMITRALRHAFRRDPAPLDVSQDGVARLRAKLRETPVSSFKSLDVYRKNYDLLVRILQDDGVPLLIATEASLYRPDLTADEMRVLWFGPVMSAEHGAYPNTASMLDGMRQFNDAARDIARDRRVPVLDVDAVVPKSLKYFQDDLHLTHEGNDVLARTATAWIASNPLPPLQTATPVSANGRGSRQP
jgi:lysophospholipase L1-like esterase